MDAAIRDIVIKTLFSAEGQIRHSYRATYPNHVGGSACFEILGFDIMLDEAIRPWLLEVNLSPSFSCDSVLDAEIKHEVLRHAMRMLNLTPGVVSKLRRDSKKQLRRNAFRSQQRKKNEINGRAIKDMTLEEEVEAREADKAERERTAREQLQLFIAHEDSCCGPGGYRRIYPLNEGVEDLYSGFTGASVMSLYSNTASQQARVQHAQEMRAKILERERMHRKFTAPKRRSKRGSTGRVLRARQTKTEIQRKILAQMRAAEEESKHAKRQAGVFKLWGSKPGQLSIKFPDVDNAASLSTKNDLPVRPARYAQRLCFPIAVGFRDLALEFAN